MAPILNTIINLLLTNIVAPFIVGIVLMIIAEWYHDHRS